MQNILERLNDLIIKTFLIDDISRMHERINAYLYPVLASFTVLYFAIQIAPIAERARTFNGWVDALKAETGQKIKI